MPSPTVIVNHKTYSGVGRLSIPLSTGTGNGDFIYIGGDPGSLPQWQANVKIAGVKYNAVQRVTLPKQGGGEAHYLCAAGTFREFPVNPGGKKINIGDYVKLEAGLYPSASLYPSTALYPGTGVRSDSAGGTGHGTAAGRITLSGCGPLPKERNSGDRGGDGLRQRRRHCHE